MTIAARRYWLFIISFQRQKFVSGVQCSPFRTFFWEVKTNSRTLCFISGSKLLERRKALGLRPHAFICFSVFGTPVEALVLVFDISSYWLKSSYTKVKSYLEHLENLNDNILGLFSEKDCLNLMLMLICCCFYLVPPVFTKIPERVITVKEDSTASIVCEAFGFPPPVIQWSRAFSPLPQGRSVVVNGTLKISRFSLQDTGSYQCKAINKLGSVATTTTLYFKRKGERYELNKPLETGSGWLGSSWPLHF